MRSKGLLQPALGETLAGAIRTLIEYVIFEHSALSSVGLKRR